MKQLGEKESGISIGFLLNLIMSNVVAKAATNKLLSMQIYIGLLVTD